MSRSIVLLSPPLFDTRAPHLACPMLAAELSNLGHRARVMDLNVEAINWLISPARLNGVVRLAQARAEQIIASTSSAVINGRIVSDADLYVAHRAVGVLRCGENLPEAVTRALSVLRDAELFYNPAAHRNARMVIDTALDVTGFAHDELTRLRLCPQEYNGRYRVSYMSDLLNATARHGKGDLFLPFFEEAAAERIFACKPDIIGISIANVYQVIPGLTLSRLLVDDGKFVIIGGTFFSKFTAEIVRHPEFFDLCSALCLSEGEAVIVALAKHGTSLEAMQQIPNLMFRQNGAVIRTTATLSNQVPDPGAADFRGLDLGSYHVPEPVLPIYLGKGCAWGKCTFCEIPQINRDFGRWRRVRTVANVAEEMRIQGDRHGARHFIFTDEDIEARRLGDLAEEILHRQLKVGYIGFTRFTRQHTPELFGRLAESGCKKLLFGLESGSQTVNDQCNKGIDLALIPSILHDCQSAGIAAHVFTIVGLPGEGETEAAESEAYYRDIVSALDLPYSSLSVSAFYLNWNSWLRRHSDEAGLTYTDDQDFPVHIEHFRPRYGIDDEEGKERAAQVYHALRWHGSWPGFDIDYSNQLWPGWEEYSVLYLTRYPKNANAVPTSWPADIDAFLNAVVRVADGTAVRECSIDPFRCSHGKTLLALAASAHPTKVSAPMASLLRSSNTFAVSQLVQALASDKPKGDLPQAISEIIGLLHSNVLEWVGPSRCEAADETILLGRSALWVNANDNL
jgi:anaerobic magnesium-protoporphyrin IX monomethyl ester cyclase